MDERIVCTVLDYQINALLPLVVVLRLENRLSVTIILCEVEVVPHLCAVVSSFHIAKTLMTLAIIEPTP